MCEREEVVGLLSLPEEVLIKIAQHLGKWQQLAQAGVADPHFLYWIWIWIQALLYPDSGFAESPMLNPDWGLAESGQDFLNLDFGKSGSKIWWIRIQDLMNPDSSFTESKTAFAESGSRLGWIWIQDFLNPNSVFVESGSRLCKIESNLIFYESGPEYGSRRRFFYF